MTIFMNLANVPFTRILFPLYFSRYLVPKVSFFGHHPSFYSYKQHIVLMTYLAPVFLLCPQLVLWSRCLPDCTVEAISGENIAPLTSNNWITVGWHIVRDYICTSAQINEYIKYLTADNWMGLRPIPKRSEVSLSQPSPLYTALTTELSPDQIILITNVYTIYNIVR